MKILFVTSEMYPYASIGGLADMSKALPESLVEHGLDVIRVLPCYRQVLEGSATMRDTGIRLQIPVGLSSHNAEVWVDDSQAPVTYFIRRDEFFDRTHLYGLSTRDYDDNFERFTFFQKAVVSLIDTLNIQPDIVHANDWQTGLLPLFLRHGIHGVGRSAAHERVLFTIHNLTYQGIFPGSAFPLSNLPLSCFSIHEMEYYSQVNCIKAGIAVADCISTVSPAYANVIRTEEGGYGLDGVLRDKGENLLGILNGADYNVWNPATDPHLDQTYNQDSFVDGKHACKISLLKEFALETNPTRPLIGIASRLAEQKGLDIISEVMEKIMQQDVSMIIIGAIEKDYHDVYKIWQERWPSRFAAKQAFSNNVVHKILAGSDMLLMPYQFEPGELNKLYSMKYGTVPIAYTSGDMDMKAMNNQPAHREGIAFCFTGYSGDELLTAINKAVALYQQDKTRWTDMVVRIMQQEYSWDHPAQQYIELYERLLNA